MIDFADTNAENYIKAVRTVTLKEQVSEAINNGIGVVRMKTFYYEDNIDLLMWVLRIKQKVEESVKEYSKRYEAR
ncbi:8255_t:CDS:2, partial [Racocetra persica]